MARWMLLCPNCNSKLLHSQIAPNVLEESYRDPFRVVPRPIFSEESYPCPHCNVESAYQSFGLIYDEDNPTV
jgi:hypothetical protein